MADISFEVKGRVRFVRLLVENPSRVWPSRVVTLTLRVAFALNLECCATVANEVIVAGWAVPSRVRIAAITIAAVTLDTTAWFTGNRV